MSGIDWKDVDELSPNTRALILEDAVSLSKIDLARQMAVRTRFASPSWCLASTLVSLVSKGLKEKGVWLDIARSAMEKARRDAEGPEEKSGAGFMRESNAMEWLVADCLMAGEEEILWTALANQKISLVAQSLSLNSTRRNGPPSEVFGKAQTELSAMEMCIEKNRVDVALALAARKETGVRLAEGFVQPSEKNSWDRSSATKNASVIKWSHTPLWEKRFELMRRLAEEVGFERCSPKVWAVIASSGEEGFSLAVSKGGIEKMLLSEFGAGLAHLWTQDIAKAEKLLRRIAEDYSYLPGKEYGYHGEKENLKGMLMVAESQSLGRFAEELFGGEGMQVSSPEYKKISGFRNLRTETALFCLIDNIKKKKSFSREKATEMLHEAIEFGTAETVFIVLDCLSENKEGVVKTLLEEERWILTNQNFRKKGDALALAVGLGEVEKATALLRKYPDLSKVRAIQTLKYLKERDGGVAAKATATMERVFFDEAANTLDEPSEEAPKAKRRL